MPAALVGVNSPATHLLQLRELLGGVSREGGALPLERFRLGHAGKHTDVEGGGQADGTAHLPGHALQPKLDVALQLDAIPHQEDNILLRRGGRGRRLRRRAGSRAGRGWTGHFREANWGKKEKRKRERQMEEKERELI